MKKALSDTEKKVLDALVKDSSRTFAEIGKELDLSRQAVAYNVLSLKNKGVIERFTVDLDYEKLGIGLPVLIFVKSRHVNVRTFKEIMEVPALKDKDSVQYLFTLSGEYAFGLMGWWKDKEEYGLWKTELIEQLINVTSSDNSLFELEEFVIWDFYKRRGRFEVPEHIKSHLTKRG
jgi:Lrp/AsnC family leucine-responsive transcriptional regulator